MHFVHVWARYMSSSSSSSTVAVAVAVGVAAMAVAVAIAVAVALAVAVAVAVSYVAVAVAVAVVLAVAVAAVTVTSMYGVSHISGNIYRYQTFQAHSIALLHPRNSMAPKGRKCPKLIGDLPGPNI